ncbi:MAG: ATP synthase F1 subunit gamma [Desulfuromonas sp.]|nr:MAG: ATP synthase F1 subunit gamma [Desulfuromonas sp.]
MPSLKDIKKRIGTVKNTQQITKAMKMVAAAKLRRAQDAAVAARPYAEKLQSVLSNLAMRDAGGDAHVMLTERGKGRALLVLMTADRGLCGGFNANVSKAAERFIKENEQGYEAIDLTIIGRKGKEFLKSRVGDNIKTVHENIGDISYKTASLIGEEVVEAFNAETYDAVFVLYNAFQSAITQVVTLEQVLPIQPKEVEEDAADTIDYIYEPNRGEVLEQILPKMVEVQFFRALLESNASEQGARMSAMDSASRNASEMIDKLTLQYNRARQAAITKELMEIISGAESIK